MADLPSMADHPFRRLSGDAGRRLRTWRDLRRKRREREAMLLDLGALVYELHRQGKRAPELLQDRAVELGAVDRDVRALEDALEGQ